MFVVESRSSIPCRMESRGALQKPGEPTVSDQEALIMHVESHPWLYDTSRSDYRDSTKRDNAWAYIAQQMGKVHLFDIDV